MKNLKEYIIEKQNFLVNKKLNKRQDKYEYHPKTREELQDIITDILERGITDLNCIDVSEITNMSYLFYDINNKITVKEIDISEWDVSMVTNMHGMFVDCDEFNCNLSNWNVSKVNIMNGMFAGCNKFNSDISNWDVSRVTDMNFMFKDCYNFNVNLYKWNVNQNVSTFQMFEECKTLQKNNKIPKWYTGEI